MKCRYTLGLLATVAGCFAEPSMFVQPGDPDSGTSGGSEIAASTGDDLDSVGSVSTDGGNDSASDEGSTSSGASELDSTSEDSTGGEDESGEDESSTGAGEPWPSRCLPPPVDRPCPAAITGTLGCIAAPTEPVPAGCGDVEERRVALDLPAPGQYLVALVDPADPFASPDTMLTVIGVDPADLPASCVQGTGPGGAAVAVIDATELLYDAVITIPSGSGIAAPFTLRPWSSLCPVDESCCEPGPVDTCRNSGLRDCVASVDSYCGEQEWDPLCITLATTVCGAACAPAGV